MQPVAAPAAPQRPNIMDNPMPNLKHTAYQNDVIVELADSFIISTVTADFACTTYTIATHRHGSVVTLSHSTAVQNISPSKHRCQDTVEQGCTQHMIGQQLLAPALAVVHAAPWQQQDGYCQGTVCEEHYVVVGKPHHRLACSSRALVAYHAGLQPFIQQSAAFHHIAAEHHGKW